MVDMGEPITFQATLVGIRTTVDSGTNVTFSIPETHSQAVKELFDAKRKILNCAIVLTDGIIDQVMR